MIYRSLARFALAAPSAKVPEVIATFGAGLFRTTFKTHPAVMMIARLIEMRYVARPRAVLTQQNIDDIRKYDEGLAQKCQVAKDNNLKANFMEIDYLDDPNVVERLRREDRLLTEARKETYAAPAGEYKVPKVLKDYYREDPVPRSKRYDLNIPDTAAKENQYLREWWLLHDQINEHQMKRIKELESQGRQFIPPTTSPTAAVCDMLPSSLSGPFLSELPLLTAELEKKARGRIAE